MNSIKHFVFATQSEMPSPTGRGSESDWLKHYKLTNEDSLFIPWTPREGAELPEPGDMLWMQTDGDIIAVVKIDGVQEDIMGGRLELWFNGSNLKHIVGLKSTRWGFSRQIPDSVLPAWLKHIEK